jgi:hypothetical protein
MNAPAIAAPSLTLEALMAMSAGELSSLYARSEPGPMPDGVSAGLATAAPGTSLGAFSEKVFAIFWQGKVFDRTNGRLLNRILGFLRAVPARIFIGESWSDGRPAIIIDYLGVSLLCAPVRDEIRQVGPSLYLGYAYVRTPGRPVAPLYFALDFSAAPKPA